MTKLVFVVQGTDTSNLIVKLQQLPTLFLRYSNIYGVDHRRLPQFVFDKRATSKAGPRLPHVSIVERGVPIMMICGAKTCKTTNDVSARPHCLILTGRCNGRTGWSLKARFCTMCSFMPASNQCWKKHYRPILSHVSTVQHGVTVMITDAVVGSMDVIIVLVTPLLRDFTSQGSAFIQDPRRGDSGPRTIPRSLPRGSIVVPFCGLYLGSYKVIPKGTTMEPMIMGRSSETGQVSGRCLPACRNSHTGT